MEQEAKKAPTIKPPPPPASVLAPRLDTAALSEMRAKKKMAALAAEASRRRYDADSAARAKSTAKAKAVMDANIAKIKEANEAKYGPRPKDCFWEQEADLLNTAAEFDALDESEKKFISQMLGFFATQEMKLDGLSADDSAPPLEPPTEEQLNEFSVAATKAHNDLYRALLEDLITEDSTPDGDVEARIDELMKELARVDIFNTKDSL